MRKILIIFLAFLSTELALASVRSKDYKKLELNSDYDRKDAFNFAIKNSGEVVNIVSEFDTDQLTFSRSVGMVLVKDGKTNEWRNQCSGALISPNLFLTAKHCLVSQTDKFFVLFNYDKHLATDNPQIQTENSFSAKKIYLLKKSDAMIIELDGDPGITQGWLKISKEVPERLTTLYSIHHPETGVKTISRECYLSYAQKVPVESYLDHLKYRPYDFRSTCQVLPGSSGAPLLNERGEIVGIARYLDMALDGYLYNGILNVLEEIDSNHRKFSDVFEALSYAID